ncbi:hypothetical protein Pmani_005547 [Petrolisthes manimaculis]|uniref:Uncharacterized protein n=1 Tax=Petrolisthes manimaculis TaxID=1843537 RepID=A0AAE1QBF5_9EUCA|nr:hypothetical protein Pmani_005547 [Petrolisthes manimaculis]
MSVGVLSGSSRCFHWESASKPALTRCTFRPAPAHTHHSSPFHHRRRHRHRSRRRHQETRRGSDVPPPSLSSWQSETSSLLTSDTPTLSFTASAPRPVRPTPSPAALLLARSRMSGGAGRGVTDVGGRGTSTAAAREVKQYLSRTLFPRPASTLHGYASLYRRLTQLPTHRKQRGQAGNHLESDPSPGPHECGENLQLGDPDDRNSLEGRMPSPPRVEIHIYVPTAATAAAPTQSTPQEEESLTI